MYRVKSKGFKKIIFKPKLKTNLPFCSKKLESSYFWPEDGDDVAESTYCASESKFTPIRALKLPEIYTHPNLNSRNLKFPSDNQEFGFVPNPD